VISVVNVEEPAEVIPQSGWSLVYTNSQETTGSNGYAINAFDGNTETIWQPTQSKKLEVSHSLF